MTSPFVISSRVIETVKSLPEEERRIISSALAEELLCGEDPVKKDVAIAGYALFCGPLLCEAGFGAFLCRGSIAVREYGGCFLRKEAACVNVCARPGVGGDGICGAFF